MRLSSLLPAFVLLFSLSVLSGQAETITTFTLTHGTDTIEFSLSDSTPFDYRYYGPFYGDEFSYTEPLRVNGILHTNNPAPGDAAIEGFEQLQAVGVGSEFFVEYRTGIVNGLSYYRAVFEQGIQIYSMVNGKLVFTSGTYVFPSVVTGDYIEPYSPTNPSMPLINGSGDVLVITQRDSSTSPVPEPSSLLFLGTGLAGALGIGRRFVSSR